MSFQTHLDFLVPRREVIKQKDDISDSLGFPDWQLTLWLLFAWVCVYLVIVKGVKSSGKISYFLAIFPYIVMLILLVRAATLKGAWNGIKYFITPDFKRLLEPQVLLKRYMLWCLRFIHLFSNIY